MISFPFDSIITDYDETGLPLYDRAVKSTDFAGLFRSFLTNGVWGSGMFSVTATSGLTLNVSQGQCLILGRFGKITESAGENITLNAGDPHANRVDSVVLRMDITPNERCIKLATVQGIPDSSPLPPVLTRNETVYELAIANVYLTPNCTTVYQRDITDTRLDNARCGLVAAINSHIDTTSLYQQIQNDLANFKNVEQANFTAWLDTIKELLNQQEIGELISSIESKATTATYKVYFDPAKMTATPPHTQTISVPGILATDNPIVDMMFEPTDNANAMKERQKTYLYVTKIETGDGTITVTCAEKRGIWPVNMQLKVIR